MTEAHSSRRSRAPRDPVDRAGATTGLFVTLVGAWLVIVAGTEDYVEAGAAGRWSDVASGSLLIVLGLLRGVWLRGLALLSGLVIVVGVWLVVSPLVTGSAAVARWTEIAVGIVAAVLGLAGLILAPARRRR